jgi:hypothetical protein
MRLLFATPGTAKIHEGISSEENLEDFLNNEVERQGNKDDGHSWEKTDYYKLRCFS